MKSLYFLLLLALNFAVAHAGWSVSAYDNINFTGKGFYCYSNINRSGICCDWSQSSINDKIKSFAFDTTSNCGVIVYKDWKCSGDTLGSSYGTWYKSETSAAGEQMSSAYVYCN